MTRRSGAATLPVLGYALRDALRLMHADFQQRTGAQDLRMTPALFRLLFRLQRVPGSRQVEIADLLEVTPVTVGRMLDRLEAQGLVRREAHPDDRRATRVFLDRRGSALMTRLGAIARETEERALAGLAEPERAALLELLGRVRANLAGPAGPARRGRRHGT